MSSEGYTVLTTMKNEAPYILDWVAHYKTLGFDNIVVCTNDCTDPTVEILTRLQEMGHLRHHNTIVRAAGPHRSALRQALNFYSEVSNAEWLFVCDVDEYLNIHVGNGRVQSLIEAAGSGANIISIPWRIFGSGGVQPFQDIPVTQQFYYAELEWDEELRPTTGKFVKSIFSEPLRCKRLGIHFPILNPEHVENAKWTLPDGKIYVIDGARTPNPPLFSTAQINHYALRSRDSFLVKRARGRANHVHQTLGEKYWDKFNLNHEADRTIDRYKSETEAFVCDLKKDPILNELHINAVKWHDRKAKSLNMDPEMDSVIEALPRGIS